ncbi:hypothetical protein PTUN_a3515 [Pseudoalteromonas tunicata]|nr:hypothetical protein PTUN_a3515 [Pseudoalteromonas tunicata]
MAIVLGWFKARFSAIKHINPQQLTLLINRENATAVDIRALKDFNTGHIASSVHLSAEKAKEKEFSALEKLKNAPIIVVCNTGMTASGVADNLHKAGFEHVFILSGGIGAWQSAGLPMTTER